MIVDDPLWYKDAILYELHVRAFYDSIGDGKGDFRGLTEKLDYLQDLGVTAIWLLPFYPSPLRDDGYDIADYMDVNPDYGKLDDFRAFLEAAHDRGLRVITELVVNHTSDQHPWFRRARLAPPGSPERDFYVWSETPEKYQDARVIFKDFEPSNWSWDPVAKAYFWHRFYSHQPDLNFENPAVWEALLPVVDFWMGMGVDGMRLDAVPYLFEREGTNCENLQETHGFLKALRRHTDERFPGRVFLSEANQWPEDAVAYFGDGDECQMSFHFPLMPRLFMALHQEDRFPIHDIMAQTPPIPDNCQWCIFLRNHDELTLEMVTDEERDYMYRAYARDRTARINLGIRRRLAPLLGNNRRRIELMTALLLSLPGTPVLYYGDEIGMGDNIYLGDRNGVRTPMQWSGDRNAGFSRANPQKLYLPVIIDPEYHFETVNVEAQQGNPSSLLWWVKRLIALRKESRAFGRGSFELLRPDNSKVLAFVREYEGQRILVVANLSRFVQCARLDLKAYAEVVPEEMLGRTQFPRISEAPYLLTLGPHSFMWLSLSTDLVEDEGRLRGEVVLPILRGRRALASRFQAAHWDEVEALLPAYLRRSRLLPRGMKATRAEILRATPVTLGDRAAWFLVVRVEGRGGIVETLSLGLGFVPNGSDEEFLAAQGTSGFARVDGPEAGVLYDALSMATVCRALLSGFVEGHKQVVESSEIAASRIGEFTTSNTDEPATIPLTLSRGERMNSVVLFGESLVLRTYRRFEDGVNPDLEIGRFLAARPEYSGAAPVVGAIEHRRRGGEPATIGVLRGYVPNQGSAWQHALDQLSQYFERVAANAGGPPAGDSEDRVGELIGGFQESVRLLGRRTAELHRVLASDPTDPSFAPEPFGKLYQRSIYQSMRNLLGRLRDRLARELDRLPESIRPLAERLAASHDEILSRFRGVLDPSIDGHRIRCHGDYHLGQLLYTGKDFVVVDFEGEEGRPIGERRVKRSPLRDVASLVRSLDYAVQSALLGLPDTRGRTPGVIRPEDRANLEPWARAWHGRIAREYVAAYFDEAGIDGLIPSADLARNALLELFLLEKALGEIDFELNARPEWVIVPLRGALRLIGADFDVMPSV